MKDGYGYRSEQRLRKENQDTYGVFELGFGTLLVVCDGMGGHVGGAQASALAVRTVHDTLAEAVETDSRVALKRAIETANRVIYETSRKNYRLTGMGTTIVAALILDVPGTERRVAHIAHVGDSRAFLLRGGEIRQLTRDHTMVNLFVDAELLAPEDAATHPEAHVLSRSLGVERHVEVEEQATVELQPGDRVLLTSDGVHGVIGSSSLAALDWNNPQRGADDAMMAVDAGHGDDNATLVAWGFTIHGASSPPTRPPDALADIAATSEPHVRPLGAHGADAGPEDDVAPIEDLDDLAASFAPKIGPHALTQQGAKDAQQRSNARAFGLLGALAIIGAVFSVLVFRERPEPRPVPISNGAQAGAEASGARPAPRSATADLADPLRSASIPAPDLIEGPAPEPPHWAAIQPLILHGADWSDVMWRGDGSPMVVDADAFQRAGGGESAHLAWGSGLAAATGEGAWAPPPRCVDCTRSLSRPSSSAYLRPEGSEVLAGSFYKPSIPNTPSRSPVTPQRYSENAPRGPAQATAIRQARGKECASAMRTVDAAMDRSIDNAVLYRTAWICFNENDQYPLSQANVATFREFNALEAHLRGAAVNPGPPAAPGQHRWTWAEPAVGGVEYRLERFMTDREIRGFQDVMYDMLGEASVADQLGIDLLLEATAAAAASRNDAPDDLLIDMWARRVYYTTAAMHGHVGSLIRERRPELGEVIENLLFESTGGDPGTQAIAAGLPNTYVPEQVALAQARALGLNVLPPPVLAAAEPIAARPQARVAHSAAPVRRAPSAPPPPPPSAAPPPSTSNEPLTIKVYSLRK